MNVRASAQNFIANLLNRNSCSSNPQHKLIFVYQGRQGQWIGMGRELYRDSAVFRQAVQNCSDTIEERHGIQLVDAFHNDQAAALVQQNEFHSILAQAAIHIGLTDFWRSENVLPEATVGLSLGEITSTYMNEALSLKEVMSVARTAAKWDERVLARGKLLLVKTTLATGERLVETCSVKVELFAEMGPNDSILFCASDDLAAVEKHLDDSGVEHHVYGRDYAYHTERFTACRNQLMTELQNLSPAQPKCRFYSSFKKGLINEPVSFDADYWYWLLAKPVYFNSAIEAAILDGYDTFVNIGPHPALTDYILQASRRLGAHITVHDSMRNDEAQFKTLKQTIRELKRRKFVRCD